MSSSKNLEYEKTAFLSKSNSSFIEEMYIRFVNNDPDLPESWREYFNEIGDEADVIIKEINGPSWGPSKKKIDIAKKINSNIHNIDSRQIYIDMDIGTAKPTAVQQSQVNHFLIDVCLPSKPINLHDFQSIAKTSIERDLEKKGLTLLVGGSGLYLQALIGGLNPPAVPPQKFFRDQLEKIDKTERHKLLKLCDPFSAQRIHPEDSIRIIRALEVFYATGKCFRTKKT